MDCVKNVVVRQVVSLSRCCSGIFDSSGVQLLVHPIFQLISRCVTVGFYL